MSNRLRGQIFVFSAAVLFGFTPVLAAISYRGGNNGVNMAFLRALAPLPLLPLLCRGTARPNGKQLRLGLLSGVLCYGTTMVLYCSYEYISPGLSTTLHYLYPLYVTLFDSVRRHRRPGKSRLIGLALCLAGIALFLDPSDLAGDVRGIGLALLSGLMDAVYLTVLGREAEEPMPLYRLILVMSLAGLPVCGFTGLLMGRLTVQLTTEAWLYAVMAALLVSLGAVALFRKGITEVGEAEASLYALMEPITGVIFSILLMGDRLTPKTAAGCALILAGLAAVTLVPEKKEEENRESDPV